MKPVIIVVNGYPRSGKDTFCYFADDVYSVIIHSTARKIKQFARLLGWDGIKTPENRNMLADFKDFYVNYFDGSFKDIIECINSVPESTEFILVHTREPEEITRLSDWCKNNNYKFYSIFINRPVNKEHGNHADANVEEYVYDITVDNTGTLEEYKKKSLDVLRGIKEECTE